MTDVQRNLADDVRLLKAVADESPNGVFISKEVEAVEKAFETIRKDVVEDCT